MDFRKNLMIHRRQCGLREKFGIWKCEKRRKLTEKWWTGRGGEEAEVRLWGDMKEWYFDKICGLLRGKEGVSVGSVKNLKLGSVRSG